MYYHIVLYLKINNDQLRPIKVVKQIILFLKNLNFVINTLTI